MGPVRKATNRGRNIIGYFPSIKMGRMINFESLIERDFIYLLDFEPGVEQFCEQPMTIEYHYEGKKRRYTPDFHVVHSGQDLLFECKPKRMVDDPENQLKFEAARRWCSEQGWTFGLVTDERLTANFRVENVKLLTRFARYVVDAEVKGQIFAFLSSATGPIRIAEVMRTLDPETPQRLTIPILHMAFHHEVYISLNDERITVDSAIALSDSLPPKGFLPL